MSNLATRCAAALSAVLDEQASTRSAGLIRIGLMALVWTRWANDMVLFRHLQDGLWPLGLWFFLVTPLALVGYRTRFSVPASALSTLLLVYYAGHTKGIEGYTHHHTTLLCWATVWLSFTPCGRSYSLDRWLAVQNAERRNAAPPPPERGPVWGLKLLALQASAVYFWGAVEKCNVGFLSGARMAHFAMYFYSGSTALEDTPLLVPFLTVSAVLVVVFEFALAFGLFWPQGRRWLAVPGLLMHGAFYVFLSVFTFSATMWVMYLAYFRPDAVHAVLDRLQGVRRSGSGDVATDGSA